MKRIVFTVLICISLSLIGCKSKQKRTEQTPMETPAPTISVQYSHFDERLIQYPVSERISWAYYHFPGISVDTQNEINRILYEKGFDCQIDFISTDGYVGNEYTEWLDMYEKNQSRRSLAYHQHEVLYLISPKGLYLINSVGIAYHQAAEKQYTALP